MLLVTPRYLPSVGGTEIHTYEIARRLTSNGHTVTVLTTDLSGGLNPVERIEGIEVVRVKAWPQNSDYFFAPAIYHFIKQGRWDLVHCQGVHTFVAPFAMAAASRTRTPYVVTFHSGGHSSRLRTALRGLQWSLLRPLLARAERLISVSNFEADFFQRRLQLPSERFHVIPNGSYLPVSEPPRHPNRERLILSVGRLERYKGHHRVIAALPKLLEQYPDIRLRIVGSGPYEGALRQMADKLNVAHRVEIRPVPGANRGEMAQVLLGASLVILLSDYESQGIAVLEALALRRPVLVADTSALRELVQSGLVRAARLGSTSDEIAKAVSDQLRRPLVPPDIELPSWDDCFSAVNRIYDSVLTCHSYATDPTE